MEYCVPADEQGRCQMLRLVMVRPAQAQLLPPGGNGTAGSLPMLCLWCCWCTNIAADHAHARLAAADTWHHAA
jgi:hypothetical protein